MPNEPTEKSPVDAASPSIEFDEATREVKLEQIPGEQPVTVGAARGPEIDSEEGTHGED
jgi:hypothetical protein